jgi:hypothetical protein
MISSLQFTSTVLGFGLAGAILMLVRHNRLHVSHALFWIAIAASASVLGVFPELADRLARPLGIAYGPLLVVLLALVVIIVKAVHADIAMTRLERDLRRLNQKLAIIEAEHRPHSTPDV